MALADEPLVRADLTGERTPLAVMMVPRARVWTERNQIYKSWKTLGEEMNAGKRTEMEEHHEFHMWIVCCVEISRNRLIATINFFFILTV